MTPGMLGAGGSAYLKLIDTIAQTKQLNSSNAINTWYTVVDIEGPCLINYLTGHVGTGGSVQLRLTIDGVVKTYSASNSGSNSLSFIVAIDNGSFSTTGVTKDSPRLPPWFAKEHFKVEINQPSMFGSATSPSASADVLCALVDVESLL